ncbi:uncharacterized protein TNCV_695791 [Trichonephila clavipes]|nr:uncharacterized protein TNCV_695791 [Trichonephila clavipes]
MHLWISFCPNAAVFFLDVAIQPEVRLIAKQNSLMKIGDNGNLVLGPFDESTPCLMIVLMNCQTKLKINHLTAVKSVAILESYLQGRALNWYQIFGSALMQNTATDFALLKAALSKAFPAIQNMKDLEARFYASQQRQNQEPTDFVCDLLKLQKKLELGMPEKVLVDNIFVRLEPQVQDYVEVQNRQNTVQLLEVLAKFEERYSCKAIWGLRSNDNVKERGWNERRISNVGNNRGIWRNFEVVRRPSNGRNDCRGNYENRFQGNQWFGNRIRFQNDDRRFNDRGYEFRSGGQKEDFSRGDHRNWGSSENFS